MNEPMMPGDTDIRVTIELVSNGVVVRGLKQLPESPDGKYRQPIEEEYVYSSLDEALKEIPSIVSVLKDGHETPMSNLEKRTSSGKSKDEQLTKVAGGTK